MNDSTTPYRVNTPSVAAEDLDEEIVAVSFESGRYYSMRATAAAIWRLIDSGLDVSSMVAHFDGDEGEIRAALDDFVRRLVEHGLIVESVAGAPRPSVPGRQRFELPILEEFDEMKEMLLYDPIHDVDETGWPHVPENSLSSYD